MKLIFQHIIKFFLVALIFFSTGCSTKKKSWVNRQFHNTTAKYNGYFNGNQSVKNGVKKIEDGFTDDYTAVLPVFKLRDLKKSKTAHSYMDKAIKKGSIVIQSHSMKIKGKEYCKWIDDSYLMVGKSYFYKGEFEDAVKTFSFIKNEYKGNDIQFDASLWLIRSLVEKQDFVTAEVELEELINNRNFPKKMDVDLAKICADFYLKKADFPQALKYLLKIDKLIKRKNKKVRYNYITAQLYQQSNNNKGAKNKYEEVLRSSPDYKMVFNAKMNLARSLESGSRDTKKMRQKLLKMTKDIKNKEYLDQIYFTLAEMDINNSDTLSSISNYLLSTVNSIENNTQKSLSFLALARIDFSRSLYKESKVNYDSTLFYMNKGFREYGGVKEKHEILNELVYHLDVISLQDSLQALASLTEADLSRAINLLIQQENKKEREIIEAERSKQQMMYKNNRNRGRGELFGNNTSGGNWYFYNPATLSFGLSEFRKKWGKRKLEDDWRRKDKEAVNVFEIDSIATDSIKLETLNKKDPNYYLEKLPKTQEALEKSNEKIKESIYQAGVIYKNGLKDYSKSSELFMSLLSRFPNEKNYAALAYYNVYINNSELGRDEEAEVMKSLLLHNFPKSIYAQLLTNPNFQDELTGMENEDELTYQDVYELYVAKKYVQVIEKCDEVSDSDYKSKYLFLNALSFLSLEDSSKFISSLNKIINIDEDESVVAQATYLLEAVKNPEKMKKSNEQALTETPYLFRGGSTHISLFILPKEGVDINYLKTLISDYHSNDFENEVFEISAMLMGKDKHLLMIKTFESSIDVVVYNQMIMENAEIVIQLNKSDYKLLAISFDNFKEFYKNKDVEGYYNFFKKNYLDNN